MKLNPLWNVGNTCLNLLSELSSMPRATTVGGLWVELTVEVQVGVDELKTQPTPLYKTLGGLITLLSIRPTPEHACSISQSCLKLMSIKSSSYIHYPVAYRRVEFANFNHLLRCTKWSSRQSSKQNVLT